MTRTNIFTTAPKDYDFGSTTEISPNVGICMLGMDKDKPVRRIVVDGDTYDGRTQMQRYMSGLYFTRDAEGFKNELLHGGVIKASTSWRLVEYRGRGPGTVGLIGANLRDDGVIDFWGGAHGKHSVLNDGDLKRINAHWKGYVQNTKPNGSPRRITKEMLNRAELKTGEALSE
jgi:hypothetical protein